VGGVTRLHFLAEKISSLILYPSWGDHNTPT
jgi:hypothetical protein